FSYEKRCTVFHSISHKMGNFLGNILNTQVGSVTAFEPFFGANNCQQCTNYIYPNEYKPIFISMHWPFYKYLYLNYG
ncbi:hypothetical protein, partial [Leuconostoc falkenbergense]|uniref:hypothetical protein n=1 Tax=Leuconostoc falkenbergense TaxID=2766470 RepID=UPI0021AA4D8A